MNTLPENIQSAIENANLAASVNNIMDEVIKGRKKSTAKTYAGPQKEFLTWCKDKYTGMAAEIVTEDKLLVFLREKVVNRERKCRKRTIEEVNNDEVDGDEVEVDEVDGNPNEEATEAPSQSALKTIGHKTVLNYVSAIVKLWSDQKLKKMNNHPCPRGQNVKEYLLYLSKQEAQRKRANFTDRGIGSFIDGYTSLSELERIANKFLDSGSSSGHRDRCAFLLSHYGIMRGENVRMLEFPDLLCLDLPNEGPTECKALVLMLLQGKTNQFNKREYAAMIRAKDVRICGIGSLAMYFFERFHVKGESFPSMERNEDWFNYKVLKADSGKPTDELSAESHRKRFKATLNSLGLNYKAALHVGRGSAARMAEFAGADDNQIRRQGRWNNQAMENCYLTTIPKEPVRALAGFDPKKPEFFLPRSLVMPSATLMDQFFPDVNRIIRKRDAGELQETSVSLDGFLNVMMYLKIVLLQDAAVLKSQFPGWPIWNHGLFNAPEFLEFQRLVLAKVADADELRVQGTIERVMPELCSVINNGLTRMSSSFDKKIDGKLQEIQSEFRGAFRDFNVRLSRMTDVFKGMTFKAQFPSASGSLLSTDVVSLSPSNNANNDAPLPSSNTDVSSNLTPLVPGASESQVIADTSSSQESTPPHYKMKRSICTVEALWEEWIKGVGDSPSVKSLEEAWKTKWRKDPTESRFFNRRIIIIRKIEKLMSEDKKSEREAIEYLETLRKSNGKTLDWLGKELRK